ncbi:MAG: Uma2 family endonuclease [bacterium]
MCEVLSPSTAQHDRVRKLPVYAGLSIPPLRLVDPEPRTLKVYSILDKKWVLLSTHGEDETVSAPPFEAIPLSLTALWSE